MPRNLDRRIEMLIPIDDAASKKELIEDLDVYFRDNTKAWALQSDGSYSKVEAGKSKNVVSGQTQSPADNARQYQSQGIKWLVIGDASVPVWSDTLVRGAQVSK